VPALLDAPCCQTTPLIEQLFHALYCCAVTHPEPMPPDVRDAYLTFCDSFRWLCPYTPPADCPSLFIAVGEAHENICPHTFDGDRVVETYTKNHISTTTWGPTMWTLLHHLAEKAEKEHDPALIDRTLRACTKILPCGLCRNHLAEMISLHPTPDYGLDQYVIDLHNIVNHRLGKPLYRPPRRQKKPPLYP
jgi:hypothetical protein